MADEQSMPRRVRRRASRAAGPAKGESSETAADKGANQSTVRIDATGESKRAAKRSGRDRRVRAAAASGAVKPPRRPAHRSLVGWISLAVGVVFIGVLAWGVTTLIVEQRSAELKQAREQRFVDTATQTVVNMYSYTPDNIDESVDRFFDGTSGPLRGMLSANNNVDNIKGLYRATNGTSEVVVNGAALEGIDPVSDNASVLVSIRVTVADIDGVNKPSRPYRLRIIVHEDETGRMTGYDLKYPNGGN